MSHHIIKTCALLALGLGLVACGGDDSSAGTGGAGGTGGTGTGGGAGTSGGTAGTGAGGSGGTASAQYPAGPYGKAVGDVMQNYSFHGYVNDDGTALSSTLTQSDFDLQAVRASGKRYALIHLATYICSGCKSAADDLGQLSLPVQQAGGAVIEALFGGDLDAWITAYDLKVTTAVPEPGGGLVGGVADREHAFIVELSTMQIVWYGFGSYATTDNSSAKQGLAEMQTLLAAP